MMPLFRRLGAIAVFGLLAIANVSTQKDYLRESAAVPWQTTFERARGLRELPARAPIAVGLPDYPLPELAALYAAGHPAWNINGVLSAPLYLLAVNDNADPPLHDDSSLRSEIDRRMREPVSSERFYLEPGGLNHHFRRFDPPKGLDTADAVVLLPARDLSVVNGSQDRPAVGRFYAAKLTDQRDTLIQVDTSLGHIITPGHLDDVGMWQWEPDFSGAGRGMQAVGQHILFEVLGPVSGSRLVLDFTSAALAGEGHALPPAKLYGATEQTLHFAGRGAGRVLSEPIEPRDIDGHHYIALELDQNLAQFQSARSGLAGLYNTRLALDSRSLVGFVRNISLLTPDQVAALQPPAAVTSFPGGLLAPGLLFSGVSEDGWVADRVWFQLAASGAGDRLRIKGDIPSLGKRLSAGMMQISVDGVAVGEQKLTPGAFDLDLPIPDKAGLRRIDLQATATDTLPKPDGRLVSFHLASIALAQQAGDGSPAR